MDRALGNYYFGLIPKGDRLKLEYEITNEL